MTNVTSAYSRLFWNASNGEFRSHRTRFFLSFFFCPFSDLQTGISNEVLTEVAHLLADGSVFDLVAELAEAQRSEEQVLHKQLMDLRSDHSGTF